jgi:hypothetical protein
MAKAAAATTGGKKKMAAAALATFTKTDQRWITLRTWVRQQLAAFSTPRVSDIVLQGKRLGLKAKEVRLLIQADLPEYRITTSKIYQSQKRSRIYNTRELGVLACDIAFFGKLKPELGRLSVPYLAGCLVARDVLSRYVYAIPLQKGKTKESIRDAFLKLFEAHSKVRDYPIRAILFDGEAGVSSLMVKSLLSGKRISLHVYEYSKVKSAMAEGLIKQLRASFERLRLSEENSDASEWHQMVDRVVDSMNAQKLVVNDKRMSFSPNDITRKTLGRFLTELEKLNPVYLFSHYSIDTDMLDFRYEVGSYVALKQKAISSGSYDEKRSEINVDSEDWVIVKKVAYFSMRMRIVLCYVIESLIDKQQIVAPEDSLVQISPPSATSQSQLNNVMVTSAGI